MGAPRARAGFLHIYSSGQRTPNACSLASESIDVRCCIEELRFSIVGARVLDWLRFRVETTCMG